MTTESKIKFSRKFIDDASPVLMAGAKQVFFWDTEERGLGLRVTSTGGKAYIFQGRVKRTGATRRVTIGQCDAVSLTEARSKAAGFRAEFSQGIDPTIEKKKTAVKGATLNDVMLRYIAEKKTKNGYLKDSTKNSIQMLIKRYVPHWLDLPIIKITRSDVVTEFQKISKRGEAQANLTFRYVRALFNFAQEIYRTPDDKPIIIENPTSVLKGASLWNPNKAKNSMIPVDKVGTVWKSLTTARNSGELTTVSETANDLVRFLILTGCRFSEAAKLEWADVDLVARTWRIKDPKNHNELLLPLSSLAADLLANRSSNSGFVFPARSGDAHIKDVGTTTDKLSEVAGIHLTPHDMRRTFTAIAQATGIELWRIDLLTNHKPTGVTLTNYTERSDLRYLSAEVERIGEWVKSQAEGVKA